MGQTPIISILVHVVTIGCGTLGFSIMENGRYKFEITVMAIDIGIDYLYRWLHFGDYGAICLLMAVSLSTGFTFLAFQCKVVDWGVQIWRFSLRWCNIDDVHSSWITGDRICCISILMDCFYRWYKTLINYCRLVVNFLCQSEVISNLNLSFMYINLCQSDINVNLFLCV